MTSSLLTELRGDCAQCAALCCLAPAFDKSPCFGFDKPAATPCPNLAACGACRIHESRAQSGFGGCVSYDCFGAGQRVTQEVFGGRKWLSEPDLKVPMTRAFMAMRRLHEMLALLKTAEGLPLHVTERRALAALSAALEPANGWTEDRLNNAPLAEMERQVQAFLQSLKRHVVRNKSAKISP